MNNKIKLIIFAVIAIAAAVLLLNLQNKSRQAPGQNQGQVRETSIVSGEVTKVEENKIYFKTARLEGQANASPKITFEEKVALISPATVLLSEDPLNDDSTPLKLAEIKPGARIEVYYLDTNGQNEYKAVKITLALSAEKYNVENLKKSLNK